MSYEIYKILHLVAIVLLFLSLGTLLGAQLSTPLRRMAAIAHGVALTVILIAGFGLLARLGMASAVPVWAWLKVVVWLLLGAAVVPIKRRPDLAPMLWIVLPLLGAAATWLAVAKPF